MGNSVHHEPCPAGRTGGVEAEKRDHSVDVHQEERPLILASSIWMIAGVGVVRHVLYWSPADSSRPPAEPRTDVRLSAGCAWLPVQTHLYDSTPRHSAGPCLRDGHEHRLSL